MTKTNPRNRPIAVFLAFFLGGFGAHKFYLKQTWHGIFYLLFSLTFIPIILGYIDAICYIGMLDETFSEKFDAN